MYFVPFALTSATLDSDLRIRLLNHADSVYTMAHAMTLDASEAADLVEAVYRRAAEEQIPEGLDEKLWLLSLLRQERMYRAHTGLVESNRATAGDLRRKLALKAVQREISTAFVSLPVESRELLVLVHVERYGADELAFLKDIPVEEIPDVLRVAENDLRLAVERSLGANEAELLKLVPDEWVRTAINDMVANDLPVMPPTVRTDLGPAPPQPPASADRTSRPRPEPGRRFKRSATALMIIFLAGLFAYGAARILDEPLVTDALELAVRTSSRVNLDITSSDAEDVERFLMERLNWRLAVPAIEGATLLGSQIREITSGVYVPALYYEDTQTEGQITIVAYNYALLDRNDEFVQFEPATLSQIEDPGHYELHDLGRQQLLVWRHRNNIFVAVTRGTAEALQDRVYPES